MVPQGVSKRYISNLLQYGRNKEFDISYITIQWSKVDGESVGAYFQVGITKSNGNALKTACGSTISEAVERALIKHGVTFVVK